MAGGGSKSASKAAGSSKAMAVVNANRSLQQGRITSAEMAAVGARGQQVLNASQMQRIADNRTAARREDARTSGADGRRIPPEAQASRPVGSRRSQLEREVRASQPSWNDRQVRATVGGRLVAERNLARERRQMARQEAAERKALQEREQRERSRSSQSQTRANSSRRFTRPSARQADPLADLSLGRTTTGRVPRSSSANRRLATRIASRSGSRRDSLSDLDF